MSDYVGEQRPPGSCSLTECSMSDNVALQYPDVEFIRPCNLCPHMKRITLANIRRALETPARGHDRPGHGRTGPSCGRADAGALRARRCCPALEDTDRVLVMGGGAAGLVTALQLAPEPVVLLATAPLGTGASSPGRRAALRRRWAGMTSLPCTPATLAAGAGLSDPAVARRVAEAAPGCIEWLLRRRRAVRPRAGRGLAARAGGGAFGRRIVHAHGDGTGREFCAP